MFEVNMLAAFFLTMLLIFLGALVYFRFDMLEPAVLMSATMAFSAFCAMMTADRWSLDLNFRAWVYLTGGILAFCAASAWCAWHHLKQARGAGIQGLQLKNLPTTFWIIPLMILLGGMAVLSFRELNALATELGNTKGIFYIIKTVRPAIEAQEITLSRWMSYRQLLAQMIATVAMYIFLYRGIFMRQWMQGIPWLFPVAGYLPFMIFTTGRMAMLNFVVYTVITGTVLYQRRAGYTSASSRRTIFLLVGSGIAFIGLFLLMGMFTGKTVSTDRTPMVILSHYAGLSIPAFSQVISWPLSEDGFIGSHTLLGIYRIVGRLGFDLPDVNIFLPFVAFEGIDTNVYTAEWRYILDYGVTGMLLIMALLGGMYTLAYHHLKYNASGPFGLMLYGVVAPPLVMSSIDERVLMDFVGTPVLYSVAVLAAVYWVLLGRLQKEIS